MSGPQIYFSLPPADLFQFPPSSLPRPLAPPVRERTFRSPFGIAPWLFDLAMRPEVPFAFAATYILTVFVLNAWNRQRGNKPWWIARQGFFKVFVVIHNVALALYSFATFVAMLRALVHTWPGLDNPAGLAGVADSMCKIHGPRGLGDAVTYNSTVNIWESKNMLIHTTRSGDPDPTDVGRLWNEGLAFWGWIFYLSKFYEVLDTFIIVAKGKRSPTLQTYHHAGAMLCMWAGIRYMSPPIWMFVFINSFIHAMMYTYFTCAALDIRVPRSIKRTLTTMQIAQFVFGASFAALHLFVQYDIPIATPYKVVAAAASAASSATSKVNSATSTVSSVIETPTAIVSRDIGALVKKYLLRAAGEEGVAERIGIPHDTHKPFQQAIEEKIEELGEKASPIYETRWRTEWTKTNCIDTSGEAFAIWLNLVYLFPLTLLFARFFYKAYVSRSTKPRTASQVGKAIKEDSRKAEDETEKAVEEAGKRAEDSVRLSGSQVKADVEDLHQQLRMDVKKMKEGTFRGDRRVSERVQSFEKQVKNTADKAREAMTSSPRGGKQGASPSKAGTPQKGSGSPVKDELKKEQDTKPMTTESKPDVDTERPAQEEVKLEDSNPEPTPEVKSESTDNANNEPATAAQPTAETEKVQAEDELESKQDANIADSQSLRPGIETTAEDANPAPSTPSKKNKKKNKNKNTASPKPATAGAGDDSVEGSGLLNTSMTEGEGEGEGEGMGLLTPSKKEEGKRDSDAMGASGIAVPADLKDSQSSLS